MASSQSAPALASRRNDPLPPSASTGRRNMNLIASVSRSSGLERGGDESVVPVDGSASAVLTVSSLKDHAIQEEYRAFIQDKVKIYRVSSSPTSNSSSSGKLREGISASKRCDAFAIEAYETSLFLAIISGSHRRISPVVSQITPELYGRTEGPHPNAALAFTIALLYHLATSFPSQVVFQQQLALFREGSPSLLPPHSPEYTWIRSLAASLRQMNVARFSRLASPPAIPISDGPDELAAALDHLSLGERATSGTPTATPRDPSMPRSSRPLADNALHAALDMLREKVREHAWEVLRAAYKELSSTADGAPWLARSLALDVEPHSKDGKPVSEDAYPSPEDLTHWLEGQARLGRVKRKEGVAGRWLVCKS
ncbi:hypothetical protein FB107DRAFT_203350 [Schizophyllum commune]